MFDFIDQDSVHTASCVVLNHPVARTIGLLPSYLYVCDLEFQGNKCSEMHAPQQVKCHIHICMGRLIVLVHLIYS